MLLVQGDVFLYKLKELPKDLKKIKRNKRGYVLAEGEATGHAHVIEDSVMLFQNTNGQLFLQNTEPRTLIHEEHKTINIEPGLWGIGQVQEYDHFKESARTVVD